MTYKNKTIVIIDWTYTLKRFLININITKYCLNICKIQYGDNSMYHQCEVTPFPISLGQSLNGSKV